MILLYIPELNLFLYNRKNFADVLWYQAVAVVVSVCRQLGFCMITFV